MRALLTRIVAVWVLIVAGCGEDDGGGAAPPTAEVECASVMLASVRLVGDPDCTVATHPLAASKLPDLRFSPAQNLCFIVGPAEIQFTDSSGDTITASAVAYSGIVSNPIATAGIVPIDQPCDAEGPLLVFTAATVAEISRTDGGEPIGRLVMRDTGWAEINPSTAFPGFVSERLAITAGEGGVLADAVGELYLTGDEFEGAPAFGSLCAPGLFDGLRELLGS